MILRDVVIFAMAMVMLCLLATAGCSGTNGDSVLPKPEDESIIQSPEKETQSERMLWGIWQFSYNESTSELTPIPLREAYAHFNVTPILLPPNCNDCIKTKVNSFDPVTLILDVDVTLRNPTKSIGYDVRGILYTNDYGHSLINADDWTGLWDITGGQTINPFKAFAKSVEYRASAPGFEDTEKYLMYIPIPPHWEKITFAADASWPGNCKEPYSIENFIQVGTLYPLTTSETDIQVDVRDWQDDVNKVTLVAPTITGETFTALQKVSVDTWGVLLTNKTGAGAGDYKVRLIANSTDSGDIALYDYVTISITEQPIPEVVSIYPNQAEQGSDLFGVTVSGSEFEGPGTQVKLKMDGKPDIVADNVAVIDESTITCDIGIPPEAVPGLYDVEVTNGSGLSGIGQGLFEVLELLSPNVTGINPDKATQGHDLTGVTVSGSGFEGPGAQVKLKMEGNPDIVALNVVIVEESTVTCDISIPPGAALGLYDVEVTNGSGLSGVGKGLFEVIEATQFNPVDVTPPWLNFSPYDVCVDGNYAYIAGGVNGLHIFDISDPSNPIWINQVDMPRYAYDVAVSGGYAYVADGTAGLQIIDIDPPESAYIVKTVNTPGQANGVAVSVGYAYVADGEKGLQIINVAKPELAYIVNTVDTPGVTYFVVVTGGYAYVTDGNLHIIDIDPPESAYIINAVDTPGWARGLALSGGYAYVASSAGGLQIIDIDPPESAYIINAVDTPGPGSAEDVALSGGYAYVAYESKGLQIIDIDPPESAYIVNTVDMPGSAYDVALSGEYAYVADRDAGLQIVDIEPPDSASIVNTVGTPANAYGVAVSGGYAYVADEYAGLRIIDIDPLESAYMVNTVSTLSAQDVALSGGYAYVTDGDLHIIDIDPPESAYIVNTVVTPGWAYGVAVSGGYAYVADYSHGLQIIDVDPPESAYIVKAVDIPWYSYGVAVLGGYAYVSEAYSGEFDYDHELQIIDVTSPQSAYIVKGVHMPGYSTWNGLAVSGAYAYVPDLWKLQIIDVASPEFAYIVTSVHTPDPAMDVSLSGEYAYVADESGGLRIIKLW